MKRLYTLEDKRKYNLFEKAYKLIEKNKEFATAEAIMISFLDDPVYRKKALFSLGALYQKSGYFKTAYSYLKKGLEIYDDPKFILQIVKLCLMSDDIKTARIYLNNYDFGKFEDARIAFLGELETKVGNYNEAINYFKQLRYTLEEGKANCELGIIYKLQKDNLKALEYLEKTINTTYNNKAIIEILQILLFEKTKNIDKYLNMFDYHKFVDKHTKVELERCKIYNKYLHHSLRFEDSKKCYYARQLYNYSKEEAVNHIMDHKIDFKKVNFKFYNDIDINKLYEDCVRLINESNLYSMGTSDIYRVKLPYFVGFLDGYQTDYVEVVVLPNTSRILTIYPIWDYKKGEIEILSLKNNDDDYKKLLMGKKMRGLIKC